MQYTISGKKVEVAVKKIIAGDKILQRGAFSNPDSLDLFEDIPELQGRQGIVIMLWSHRCGKPSRKTHVRPKKKLLYWRNGLLIFFFFFFTQQYAHLYTHTLCMYS